MVPSSTTTGHDDLITNATVTPTGHALKTTQQEAIREDLGMFSGTSGSVLSAFKCRQYQDRFLLMSDGVPGERKSNWALAELLIWEIYR